MVFIHKRNAHRGSYYGGSTLIGWESREFDDGVEIRKIKRRRRKPIKKSSKLAIKEKELGCRLNCVEAKKILFRYEPAAGDENSSGTDDIRCLSRMKLQKAPKSKASVNKMLRKRPTPKRRHSTISNIG